MISFFVENMWEIFFGLISAATLGFCRHLLSKTKKLEEMQKEDQIRKTRAMILDEIEPIISELSLLHSEIDGLKNAGVNEISTIKHDSDISHQ